jgi:mannose-6-phosphate isomerase-like protein (cupin superfamily)
MGTVVTLDPGEAQSLGLALARHGVQTVPTANRTEIIAEGANYRVLRNVLMPGRRVKAERHAYRSEIWAVVSGTGHAQVDRRTTILPPKSSLSIPQGVLHQLENRGVLPLVYIEVQTGNLTKPDEPEPTAKVLEFAL